MTWCPEVGSEGEAWGLTALPPDALGQSLVFRPSWLSSLALSGIHLFCFLAFGEGSVLLLNTCLFSLLENKETRGVSAQPVLEFS